jgi:hypothetical protein
MTAADPDSERRELAPLEQKKSRPTLSIAAVPRRSYGSGRLFVYTDKSGVESWYGSWRVRRSLSRCCCA